MGQRSGRDPSRRRGTWSFPDDSGEQFSISTFPEEGETSEYISSSNRSICTSYLNHQSRSHREVLRASLGLLEKQSQHTDGDNAGRMRLRGFSFPSTGEEKPSACELFRFYKVSSKIRKLGSLSSYTYSQGIDDLSSDLNICSILPLTGNYKKPKLLYCSNGGYFLRILPDGRVDGTKDRSDQHIQLQLYAESIGEVYIKSTETGQFLAMDTNGLLYGSQTPSEECLFLERLEENHYNTYISKKHAEKNWFIGLKKNGSSKLGPRTHFGQKAILFLPLPVSSD
ncbi:hypothetical protein MJT46_007217 [Ovis ammon polii x Ovis aries]|nr:hypothetical protein MJT46_007217 [Ovis ammon polii x Ovis aries]